MTTPDTAEAKINLLFDSYADGDISADEAKKQLKALLVDAQDEVFKEIAGLAIITLDTEPRGVDKAKSIPVGKFVRLDDVRAIMQRFINSSLAVRERR